MKSVKKLFVPTVYLVAVLSVVGCVFLTIFSINKYLTERERFDYSINGIIDGKVKPVQGEEVKPQVNSIIRPYRGEDVSIGRYFYDFEGEQSSQEKSIIFYENTYMQNNGVDYSNDEEFDVVSILDGEVISIEDNAIYGKVVTIKHNDNLKSVYSNVKNVLVNVGYKISQGEIFASSDTYKVDTKVKSLLHFEVYYKDNAIDPENLYTMSVSDLK